MFSNSAAFSGFAVDDIDAARVFYGDTLGLTVEPNEMGFIDGGDERGIMRGWGPPIAWFRDPAGNVLSVLETA